MRDWNVSSIDLWHVTLLGHTLDGRCNFPMTQRHISGLFPKNIMTVKASTFLFHRGQRDDTESKVLLELLLLISMTYDTGVSHYVDQNIPLKPAFSIIGLKLFQA